MIWHIPMTTSKLPLMPSISIEILSNKTNQKFLRYISGYWLKPLILAKCVTWQPVTDLNTMGLLFVNEDLGGWHPYYVVRAIVGRDMLVMNWSPLEGVARGLSAEGHVVEASTWEHMVVDPACSYVWMRFRAGSTIPGGAVVGGLLENGTLLYVVVTLSISEKRPIGYYNPVTNTFVACFLRMPITYSGTADILVKV